MFKFLKNLKNLFSGSDTVSFSLGEPYFSAQNYERYVREGFAKNPDLFACMDQIANSVSSLKWVLYDSPEHDSKRKKIDKHPLLDLIYSPDPRYSMSMYSRMQTFHLLLEGDSFEFMNVPTIGKGKGMPKELNLLRPDRVILLNGVYNYTNDKGERRTFKPEEIIRTKFYNPLNDYDGFSPLTAASRSVDLNNANRQWNLSVLKNAVKLGTWFEVTGSLGAKRKEIQEAISREFGGDENASKIMVLEGGMKVNQGNINPRDMDWQNSTTTSSEEIMRVLHFPPEMLGRKSTFANYGEARKSYYDECIIPFSKYIRDSKNMALSKIFGNVYLEIDTSVINALQEDVDKKEARLSKRYTSGAITINEYRADMGLPPLKKGEEALLYSPPMGLVNNNQPDINPPKSIKAIETAETKARNRRRYEMVESYRNRFEKYFIGVCKDQFRSERERMVKIISKSSMGTVNSMVDHTIDNEFKNEWKTLLTGFYVRVINTIGKQEMDEILSLKKSVKEDQPQFDPLSDGVKKRIRNIVAEKVNLINDGSKRILKRRIQDAVEEGLEEGQSISKIADSIDTLYLDQIIPNRSEVIARTETISTSNFAGQEVAIQSGLTLKKEWISTLDGKTRGNDPNDEFDHVHMNGVQEEMDKPYNVNGEFMMFPGDSSLGASAGNVIQCRCAEAYVVVE